MYRLIRECGTPSAVVLNTPIYKCETQPGSEFRFLACHVLTAVAFFGFWLECIIGMSQSNTRKSVRRAVSYSSVWTPQLPPVSVLSGAVTSQLCTAVTE